MKILGVIPARGGSKGVPRKNIRNLCGKPLIAYTIEAALTSHLNRTLVSTEDVEIARITRSLGAEVVSRPPELAADETLTLPVLQHALAAVGEPFDAVMTLQPTSPLRSASHIDEAAALLEKHPEADSLVSVARVPHSMIPNSVMTLDASGYLHPSAGTPAPALRRQDKPAYYARNGAAIYVTRTERLQSFIWGGRILAYVMGKLDSIDIDDAEDWRLAEAVLKHGNVTL